MDIVEASLSGVPLLTIVGEADSGAELAQATERVLTQHHTRILLDLGLCPYLDSGCLAAILALVQQVGPMGWVGAVNCQRMVMRLLGLVGLTGCSSFRIFETLDEASGAVAAA